MGVVGVGEGVVVVATTRAGSIWSPTSRPATPTSSTTRHRSTKGTSTPKPHHHHPTPPSIHIHIHSTKRPQQVQDGTMIHNRRTGPPLYKTPLHKQRRKKQGAGPRKRSLRWLVAHMPVAPPNHPWRRRGM